VHTCRCPTLGQLRTVVTSVDTFTKLKQECVVVNCNEEHVVLSAAIMTRPILAVLLVVMHVWATVIFTIHSATVDQYS